MLNSLTNNMTLGLTVIALLFCGAVVSGFSLHHLGRPLSTGVFTIHKFLTIGAATLLFIIAKSYIQSTTVTTQLILSLVITGVAIAALLFSGAMLSLDKLPKSAMMITHSVAAVACAIATGVSAYLMNKSSA